MTLTIEPLEARHFSGLREALDAVAREQRFLAFTEAPPPEQALAFYASVLINQWCLWVATVDDLVVGWCDVLPTHGQARAHVGHLGMGVVSAARGRGIGSALLRAAVDAAWASGLTRIELSVRCDNAKARALYERHGFVTEGLLHRAFKVDITYFDAVMMALLRDQRTDRSESVRLSDSPRIWLG